MIADYGTFLDHKAQLTNGEGFAPTFMPDVMFGFQKYLVEWGLLTARDAVLADCGLGKTLMQLVWAENVSRKVDKPVLVATPLAVSAQTVAEGEKFGIEAIRSKDGAVPKARIVVTNYEQLEKFSPGDFAGMVCDESSILKSFDGVRRNQITQFMRKMQYRLLCSATAAPNDYIELGTSSEALGYLGHMDMMNRFFKNDMNNSAQGRVHGKVIEWRFKGHAEDAFWRYVCSWARAVRRPSDLGFDNGDFILPPLTETEHVVESETLRDGMLFALPAFGMREQREERRVSIEERCAKVGELVTGHDSSLVWCHLNPEGDLLEKLIPNSVQVSGSDSDDAKEEKFLAFSRGQVDRLITKPKIGAWGLNFQHCAHQVSFPSNSFEQYYQQTRRSWRFGQKRPVQVDVVMTEGDRTVMENQRRKARQAEQMFERLVERMGDSLRIDRGQKFTQQETVPTWV